MCWTEQRSALGLGELGDTSTVQSLPTSLGNGQLLTNGGPLLGDESTPQLLWITSGPPPSNYGTHWISVIARLRMKGSKCGAFGFESGRSKLEGGAVPRYIALARMLSG